MTKRTRNISHEANIRHYISLLSPTEHKFKTGIHKGKKVSVPLSLNHAHVRAHTQNTRRQAKWFCRAEKKLVNEREIKGAQLMKMFLQKKVIASWNKRKQNSPTHNTEMKQKWWADLSCMHTLHR